MKNKKVLIGFLVFSLMTLMVLPIYQIVLTKSKSNQISYSGAKRSNLTPQNNRPKEQPVSRGKVDRDELALMASIIEAEAEAEPFEGKVAVGAVMLNRVQSADFPGTLAGVIYQEQAFESVANNHYKKPYSDESRKAAQAALAGQDPTNGALYFWNPATAKSTWIWSRPVTKQIGDHVFAN